MGETRTFQRLSDRLAGRVADDSLHDGVPAWLVAPLRYWLAEVLETEERLARAVALRLRVVLARSETYRAMLVKTPPDDLLEVVDAVLQLHPGWEWPSGYGNAYGTADYFTELLLRLRDDLLAAGSLYEIDPDGRCLVARVEQTVRDAADKAISVTGRDAAAHLRAAWVAAYGLQPDPDKAYDEAARAVESVACPLISPKADGRRTLGKAIADLKSDLTANSPKWQLTLPDTSGAHSSVQPLISMMAALWDGQVSRHSGSSKSRRQTQAEAEAAVHLAATLVQWLSTGVLMQRP